ncbi:hypothetical protein RhiXN_08985 [Rhizoctonia solani]|uniref:Uncharacterized protein n=1 Tax=Rhizoctonia solani TaxID=456999 RepID=A0A8H8NWQ5_9AGAM|nr:uncharacterized protein RhiXN_08985 [Rhizoctonia solani]QRW20010.1 hypothetical protein RhiXN_08985 [Rhizoctonia solani]
MYNFEAEAGASKVDSASEYTAGENIKGDYIATQTGPADNTSQIKDKIDGTKVPVEWEHMAGLYKTIEPGQLGPHNVLVAALQDGIDITAAKLINLLINEPVNASCPL